MGKKLLGVIFAIQFIALIAVAFYLGGIKKYGSPMAHRAKLEAAVKAESDSITAVKMEELHPENAGDSTMYDIGRHMNLFEKMEDYNKRIALLQTTLDSLKKEKDQLDRLQSSVKSMESNLSKMQADARSENLGNLAKRFDAMKVQEAVPVIVEVSDTLAVQILTRMQSRNSAKLLGAIAQTDTVKAVKLTKLLSRMGTLDTK